MEFMYSCSFIRQGQTLRIVLPVQQRNRLRSTCFRQNGQPLAGNFYRWRNDAQLLSDPFILSELEKEALEVLHSKEDPYGTWSVEIDYPSYVGWASVVHFDSISFEIEEFQPNRWTRAWRVKDSTMPAPLTKTLTVIYFLDQPQGDGDTPAMIIQSVYPGPDTPLGSRQELRDIMWDEAVFFPWENPGSLDELKKETQTTGSHPDHSYQHFSHTLLAP